MTKVNQPPPVAGLVERPEVVGQLIDSATRFTLIAAPAGWGKSTVVAEWAGSNAENRPFAFVRLGPEDDDPTSFWRYVLASIDQTMGGHTDAASDDTLPAPGIDPTRSLVPNLINRLHDLDEPLVLAFDDYHTMSNPEVHSSLAYLIDNTPRCLHIAISTRSDPPFPLAGYRAAGTISEVRAEQLAMSSEQTQQFLNRRFDIDLTAGDAALVCERTEGWPAGIQLAGLSLANEPNPSAFVASFAGDDRNIADYLATEVLRRQPADLRQFLLATSILDEFNADVCDFILETNNSAAMLEQIEHSHLFLVSLDSRKRRYRYHHLFRDWLRHEHRLTAEP